MALARRFAGAPSMSIEIRNVTKRFGSFVAVSDVSLSMPTGALTALLGPSGSGKTSLLRIIAGLERPDQGQVLFEGEDATRTDARERRVGFVFQHYALFRHMSVFENVAFGLRVRPRAARPPEAEIKARVMSLLALVQLDWLHDRLPSQLSGGQRQRVALARALAVEPRVLLLDEPFGSLDARVRQELRRWLRRLHDEIKLTSVFVTHDQEEALEVADRVVVMNQGRVEQVGAPQEIFDHPATPFVMQFIGQVNVFHGRVEAGRALLGPLAIDYPAHPAAEALPAAGYARPFELNVFREEGEGGGLWATLRHVIPVGAVVRLELDDESGHLLQVELTRERFDELGARVGERLYARPRRVRVFVEPQAAGSP
jgi:sulfate transport system ATP-binding protein